MDYASLWAEIQANPACAPHIVPSEPKVSADVARAGDQAIADILSAGRVKVVPRMVSERGILNDYPGGPIEADAVLSNLETYAGAGQALSSVVNRAIRFLRDPDGIDIGAASTRAMLDALAGGGVITAAECAGLKSLAEQPEIITHADVSRAVRGPRD
jgi:hypothetical protein